MKERLRDLGREILRKKTDNERLRYREGETETERERLRDSD